MKFVTALLVALLPISSATAPILGLEWSNVIPHNYIVVLHSHVTSEQARDYYQSVRTNSRDIPSLGHRGIRKTYDNVDGMNAFHIECDTDTLEGIRNTSSHVSTHIFTCPKKPLKRRRCL
jgi:hypothetical protein